MLEKMDEFFDNRVNNYDDHQLNCIDNYEDFLIFTAESLPKEPECKILDLGCGTGLELEHYFTINPTAFITGIDVASKMLEKLKSKFRDKNIELINESYFDIPFGEKIYDAAVSVESLHHFMAEQKISLYKKLHTALKDDGFFILTDYFALSDEEEQKYKDDFLRLKYQQGIKNEDFFHYDIPLTVDHEIECLKKAGFSNIDVLKNWGQTFIIKAWHCKNI